MSELDKRQQQAIAAIRQAFGTEAGEGSINLFVSHHLEEMPASYWQQHLGVAAPTPDAVVGLLQLRGSWGENDLENVDFTLPGDVTQYVVCVRFDTSGAIGEIDMES